MAIEFATGKDALLEVFEKAKENAGAPDPIVASYTQVPDFPYVHERVYI